MGLDYQLESERAALGCCFVSDVACVDVLQTLGENGHEAFMDRKHQTIYRSIVELAKQKVPVDLVTLWDKFQTSGRIKEIGSAHYLAQLAIMVPTSVHAKYYARLVLNEWVKRETIDMIRRASNTDTSDDDALDLLQRFESNIMELRQQCEPTSSGPVHVGAITESILNELTKTETATEKGIGTGITQIDEILHTLKPEAMYIVAARPSVGKSSFALNVCRNVAVDMKTPVLFISMEMDKSQLMSRLFCIQGSATITDTDKIHRASKVISTASIHIDDTPLPTLAHVKSSVLRWYKQTGGGLIIIDYLQLMRLGRDVEKRIEVGEISAALKSMARELHLPVMALAQLKRDVEKAASPWAKLAYLKESGNIEQDADVVIILDRPEKENKKGETGTPDPNEILEVTIAKNRHGQTGHFHINFNKATQYIGNPFSAPRLPKPDTYSGDTYDDDDDVPF